MSKTLSNLMLDTYIGLGLAEQLFLATNGSATTIVNNLWDGDVNEPEEDFAEGWTAFVEYDAAGAGASPEGKYSRISAYSETNWTFTIDTVTDAIAVGDRIVIVNNEIPLQQMIINANDVVSDYGMMELIDDSLTTANQTEYTLPLGITKENLFKVEVADSSEANDNQWRSIYYDVRPAAPGTAHTLVIPSCEQNQSIALHYRGFHSRLTAYNSVISPTLQYAQIKAALRFKAVDWYNSKNQTEDGYWLGAEQKAAGLLDVAKVAYPQRPPPIIGKTIKLSRRFIE